MTFPRNPLFAAVAWLCLLLSSPAGAAAVVGEVAQVQAPAWVERDGGTRALAPGMRLQAGDRVRTGADARVYLDLVDDGRIKLGESAEFRVAAAAPQPGLLQAAFDLVRGAFRYTTGALRSQVRQRDLKVAVGTATIGIRGTDVWGKSADDRDLVALIEGHIELARNGQVVPIAPMELMDVPRSAPSSVGRLDAATLARLAAQTEIVAGRGATASRGARGVPVTLGDYPTQAQALAVYDAVQAAGHAARIRVHGADPQRYEVRLGPYASVDDARAAAIAAQVASGRTARILK